MEFAGVNLKKANVIELIQSYDQGSTLITKINFTELKRIIHQSTLEGLYKIALNSIVLGICYSTNKTFKFIKQTGIFRYSNYVNKKCIVSNLAKEILKLRSHLKIEEVEIDYLNSIISIEQSLSIFNDFNSTIISEANKFYKKYQDRSLIKSLITYADMLFLTGHNVDRNLPLNELNYWSKEDLCSGISYLIYYLCEKFPPENTWPIAEKYILDGEVRIMVMAATLQASLKEIEIEIQDLNYKCVDEDKAKIIKPPFEDVEKSIRLGYIRTEIQSYNDVSSLFQTFEGRALSLESVVEKIYQSAGDEIFVYTDSYNFPRYVIRFIEPLYDLIVEKLLNDRILFQEEYYYLSYVFKELLLNEEDLEKIKIRSNLNLLEIIQMRRILCFFFLLFSTKIYEKHKNLNEVVIRSLVPTYTKVSLFRYFEKFTTIEKFESFMDVLTWRPESETIFDLQYHPLVEFNGWIHVPLSMFAASSFVRNVFASEYKRKNKALHNDGSRLVTTLTRSLNTVSQIITYSNIALNDCEIDVAAIWDDTIFIFECKQALHPTSIYDLRTTHDYILKAEGQLERIVRAFHNKTLQRTFEQKHLVSIHGVRKIIPCIILSNRMFNGDTYKYPVRNIHEATNMIKTGVFRAEYGDFTLWGGETLTLSFLIQYFSKGSSLVNYFFNSLSPKDTIYPFFTPPLIRKSYFFKYDEALEKMKSFTENLTEVNKD